MKVDTCIKLLTLTEKEVKLVEILRQLNFGEWNFKVFVHQNQPMKIEIQGKVEKIIL